MKKKKVINTFIFVDWDGTVLPDLLPPAQPIKQLYYLHVLQHLSEEDHCKCLERWCSQDWSV